MRIVVGTLLLLAAGVALAQRVPVGVAVPDSGSRHDRREAAKAAKAAAEAEDEDVADDNGGRDGDDKLTCEQLQAEYTDLQARPELKAMMSPQSAEQMAALNAQTQQMLEKMQPGTQPGFAKAMLQSLNPLAMFTAPLKARRQSKEMKAQMDEMMKTMDSSNPSSPFGMMQAAMPLIARSNQVRELAQQRECNWQNSLPPPAFGEAAQ